MINIYVYIYIYLLYNVLLYPDDIQININMIFKNINNYIITEYSNDYDIFI